MALNWIQTRLCTLLWCLKLNKFFFFNLIFFPQTKLWGIKQASDTVQSLCK
jgi:hypothetical protein